MSFELDSNKTKDYVLPTFEKNMNIMQNVHEYSLYLRKSLPNPF